LPRRMFPIVHLSKISVFQQPFPSVLWIRITFDANPAADLDSTCYPYADPDQIFLFDADPDPTFHPDADPDPVPDPEFYLMQTQILIFI
jgi:hypothetical protein